MRKKIVAGNWKMHMNLTESVQLISEIKKKLESADINCGVIICPPFTSLDAASSMIKNSHIQLGAQNMHFESKGAFTGEVSADMLKNVGCEFVILGHSERRTIFKETDEFINKKIHAAISASLIPIFCIGETLEEREKGITFDVVKRQMKIGLENVSSENAEKMILAYEPVWAIGTGKTATPEQAEEVHAYLRKLIAEMYNEECANNITIQYGGSVKPENAKELFSQPNIDGGLIGGACLKADSFFRIISAVDK